jgi:hypothetical protein
MLSYWPLPELTDRSKLPEPERVALVAALRSLGTLADVIRWGLSRCPERSIVDVVIQDEYTHDVVMDWDGGRYLVFDTT